MNYSIQEDKTGRRILYWNPDESVKICCFDCVYCPLGRTVRKVSEPVILPDPQARYDELRAFLKGDEAKDVDIVLLDAEGESLVYADLAAYADIIHQAGKSFALETAGCFLHNPEIQRGVSRCDELTIEMQDTSPEMFRKLHRPAEGMTFEDLLDGYRNIRSWYQGKLKIRVFLVNRYNDDSESITLLKELLQTMRPDECTVDTIHEPKLHALSIEEPRISQLIKQFE